MTAFFAPFVSLLTALGLIHMQPADIRFPSMEWFAIHMQEATSSDAVAIAAAATPMTTQSATTVQAKEVVPAVAVTARTGPHTPAAQTVQSPASSSVQTTAPVKPVQRETAGAASPLEQAVFAGLNAARAENGLSPLTLDARLSAIARAHSADMLDNDYFSHDDLSGCSASCRYDKGGYGFWSMGENIFWMSGFNLSTAASAAKVVDGWQNSPGHRANDLGDYTKVGIGVVQKGSEICVTADFATPH
jgi:uncharacterized protein YkwD